MENFLDHLCIIVKNVDDVRGFFQNRGIKVEEIIKKDGLRQFYADNSNKRARLLFVEVTGEKSYKNSYINHGFGIHHVAIITKDIKLFLENLNSSWLLHPASIKSYEDSKKIWLTKANYPILLEIFEDSKKYQELKNSEGFIKEIFLPIDPQEKNLIEILETEELKSATLSEGRIRIDSDFFTVRDFYEELN